MNFPIFLFLWESLGVSEIRHLSDKWKEAGEVRIQMTRQWSFIAVLHELWRKLRLFQKKKLCNAVYVVFILIFCGYLLTVPWHTCVRSNRSNAEFLSINELNLGAWICLLFMKLFSLGLFWEAVFSFLISCKHQHLYSRLKTDYIKVINSFACYDMTTLYLLEKHLLASAAVRCFLWLHTRFAHVTRGDFGPLLFTETL